MAPSARRACSGRVAAWSGLGWGVRYARPALLKGREKENVEPLLLVAQEAVAPLRPGRARCAFWGLGGREGSAWAVGGQPSGLQEARIYARASTIYSIICHLLISADVTCVTAIVCACSTVDTLAGREREMLYR